MMHVLTAQMLSMKSDVATISLLKNCLFSSGGNKRILLRLTNHSANILEMPLWFKKAT